MNENERIDQTPTVPTAPLGATAPIAGEPAGASTAQPKRRVGRPVLFGIGAGIALLLAGGAGLAAGMTLAGDDRDEPSTSSGETGGNAARGADRDDDDRRGNDRQDGSTSGAAAAHPAADPAALREAVAAAVAATGGSGASSIDVEAGGYDVEVQLDGGTDADVFVSPDGTVSAPQNRDSDRTPEALLDLDRIDRIVAAAADAASAAAGGHAGVVDSISTSDDPGVAFEVTVRYDRGGEVEVALADDLTVVATDLDD